MKKTGNEIERDIYSLLKSYFEGKVSGDVFRSGLRQKDSQNEDCVVSFLTGIDTQIQTGVLNVNIYVPDIIISSGRVKNLKRLTEIERYCIEFIDEQSFADYKFETNQTIQSFQEPDISQHFVNFKLKYYYVTF